MKWGGFGNPRLRGETWGTQFLSDWGVVGCGDAGWVGEMTGSRGLSFSDFPLCGEEALSAECVWAGFVGAVARDDAGSV